jgi:hypothetical protein
MGLMRVAKAVGDGGGSSQGSCASLETIHFAIA